MKCSSCGYDLYEGVVFCEKCGKRVRTEVETVETDKHLDSSSRKAPKTKYRVSKLKIFLVLAILLAMAVLLFFVVQVNRDVIGQWKYVGDTDFFTGEKLKASENGSNKAVDRDEVKIKISEELIQLLVNNKESESTEYVMEDNHVVGTDGSTDFIIEWNGFSPVFNGKLFGEERLIEDLDRIDTAEHTIKNVIFIIVFAALALTLLFVATMKGKRYTPRMENSSSESSGEVKRTAISRRDSSTDKKEDFLPGSYAPTKRADISRSTVSRTKTYTIAEKGADEVPDCEPIVKPMRRTAWDKPEKGRSGGLRSTASATKGEDVSKPEITGSPSERFSMAGGLGDTVGKASEVLMYTPTVEKSEIKVASSEKMKEVKTEATPAKSENSWFNSAGDL